MNTPRLLTAALVLGMSSIALAQGPGMAQHRGPGAERMGPPVLRAIDANADGVISADEITAAPSALAALDQNGDGTVATDELFAGRPHTGPGPQSGRVSHGNPLMLALDADSDLALSAAEIANASASLKALDADKDGQLTLEEVRPDMPGKRRHGARAQCGTCPQAQG